MSSEKKGNVQITRIEAGQVRNMEELAEVLSGLFEEQTKPVGKLSPELLAELTKIEEEKQEIIEDINERIRHAKDAILAECKPAMDRNYNRHLENWSKIYTHFGYTQEQGEDMEFNVDAETGEVEQVLEFGDDGKPDGPLN